MLRAESKVRARALQLLYAWEVCGRPPLAGVASALSHCGGGELFAAEGPEELASAVASDADRLDAEIEAAVDEWRLSRLGTVEHNILRLALHELLVQTAPPRVVINEAVRLAHWFAGLKAPAFINGVLDALARRHGRL